MNWLPDVDKTDWPIGKPAAGLKANKTIFCPYLKCFVPIVTQCYGCKFGFTGICKSMMALLSEEPEILAEIYKPVAELTPKELDKTYIVYKSKLIDISKIKRINTIKDKDSLYGVTGVYNLTIRFIPKYFDLKQSFEEVLFFNETSKKIMKFSETVELLSTGDILYSLSRDDRLLDILKITEKLNNE